MSNIAITDSQVNEAYLTSSKRLSSLGEGNDSHAAGTKASIQGFSALAEQPGILSSILDGQSIMVANSPHPLLSIPVRSTERINPQQAAECIKLVELLSKGADINKLEHAAAAALTAFNSRINLTQVTTKSVDGGKAILESAVRNESTTDRLRSQPAIEGGTDITASEAAAPRFVNVLGDMKLVELNNQLTVTLTQAEAGANKSSANSLKRMILSAERAGNKGIDAEKQRLGGAITSGVLGLAGQGASTVRTMKALGKESTSIGRNLSDAAKIERGLRQHQSAIKSSSDSMLHKGKQLDVNVENMMNMPHADSMYKSSLLRDKHNRVQIDTQKVRVTSEYANQAIRSGQGVVEGAFNVEASKESKQAGLARADQSVNSEISNLQQQTAKKAAETKAALTQSFETALNNNNSAVSAVADRMR